METETVPRLIPSWLAPELLDVNLRQQVARAATVPTASLRVPTVLRRPFVTFAAVVQLQVFRLTN
jgi:hypothetical protein